MQLAVLGHPLLFTLSPELHQAGLRAMRLVGDSRALPTRLDQLDVTLARLAREGLRGVNLTQPLKQPVLPLLARVSEAAQRARSVNTVGFDADGWWGDTTDGAGFLEFLDAVEGRGAIGHVVLLGAGGAARSLAASLLDLGADVTAVVRDPAAAGRAWDGLGPVRFRRWRTDDWAVLREGSLIINATPLAAADSGLPVDAVPTTALVVDLVYGPKATPWVETLRSRRVRAYDGVGLLVHQARLSLCAWTGRDVPVGPLAEAVGWAP